MLKRMLSSAVGCVAVLTLARVNLAQAAAGDYYAIHVVDDQSGRGVPLVYLRSVYKAVYITDSNGYIAFNEPGLMNGKEVWVDVKSYGYDEPPGAFGIHGAMLNPQAGKRIEIRLKRQQIAQRLYRMTGYGIYRDTLLLGHSSPIKEGLLNAQVTGSDTVQCAIYHGKTFWMWQDTDRVGFELGNFSMTGAVTGPPDKLDADAGLSFDYFVKKPGDFAKPMAVVPREGTNPIWCDGLTVVKDDAGHERMIAKYVAANKDFSAAETGLLVYNDEKEVLERLMKFDGPKNGSNTLAPGGHTIYVTDGGTRYAMFNTAVRVKADFASASDPKQYEAFTCLKPDGTAERKDRKLVWSWVKAGKPVGPQDADDLIKKNVINADESPFQLKDIESGKPINAAGGGIAWNAYLKCWVNIFCQQGGDSDLGEIWYSIANSPQGPWTACRKVATHAMKNNNNDLYNVVQHYELAKSGGREIYFSGTFVNTFSFNPWPTPYYNYNNIVYKLDLADLRLKLPSPPPGLTNVKWDDSR